MLWVSSIYCIAPYIEPLCEDPLTLYPLSFWQFFWLSWFPPWWYHRSENLMTGHFFIFWPDNSFPLSGPDQWWRDSLGIVAHAATWGKFSASNTMFTFDHFILSFWAAGSHAQVIHIDLILELGFPTLINRFADYINAGILQNQLINGVEGAAQCARSISSTFGNSKHSCKLLLPIWLSFVVWSITKRWNIKLSLQINETVHMNPIYRMIILRFHFLSNSVILPVTSWRPSSNLPQPASQ